MNGSALQLTFTNVKCANNVQYCTITRLTKNRQAEVIIKMYFSFLYSLGRV